MKIEYIHEPTDLQCGQAVLAMVTGRSVAEICELLHNDRETDLKEMRFALEAFGFRLAEKREQVSSPDELAPLCLLSLETPRCWHWSLFCEGVFYDPEHGIMDCFPESKRRFMWRIDAIKQSNEPHKNRLKICNFNNN